MIDEICIRNIALINEAAFSPSSRITAITGETGSGKTALLSACKLMMGDRADRSYVREGESEASVIGRLYPSASCVDEEFIIKRRLGSDGRSRVKINGEMASVSELTERVSPFIDLCSQHDQQKLMRGSEQRSLLDSWAGEPAKEALLAYKAAFEEANSAKDDLQRIREESQDLDAAVEDAKFKLSQIEEIDPDAKDYEELLLFVEKAENAEILATSSRDAHLCLSEEGGVLDGLNDALSSLSQGAMYDKTLKDHEQTIKEAIYLIEDVSRDIASYIGSTDFDLETLERSRLRVSGYQSLLRKYGPDINDVLAVRDKAQSVLDLANNTDEIEERAIKRVKEAEAALAECADVLYAIRMTASSEFAMAVGGVMSELDMGSASIVCDVERMPRDKWGVNGAEKVEFLFKPSSGMQPRPLARIASGGELSRVMLAIHAVMGGLESSSTLVFDEIDAGVGGSTALAIANVLERLSETHQIIVVTHLPQIAAKADKQYVVKKNECCGLAETSIEEVEGVSRAEEIARMLSGTVSEASLAHAEELLEN